MDFICPIENQKLYVKKIEVSDPVSEVVFVFLHDGLGSVESLKDFPQMVCDSIGINGWLYDRSGHGKSSGLEEQRLHHYLQKEATDILPKMLRKLGINRQILIGLSDGATIALIYESIYGNSEALISLAGHAYVEDRTREGIEKACSQGYLAHLREGLWKYHGSKTDLLLSDWSRIWLSEEYGKWNILKRLAGITCPSIIIQGDRDEYATIKHCHNIARAIGKNATPEIFSDCGHFPNKEKTILTVETIRKFIHENTELRLRNQR